MSADINLEELLGNWRDCQDIDLRGKLDLEYWCSDDEVSLHSLAQPLTDDSTPRGAQLNGIQKTDILYAVHDFKWKHLAEFKGKSYNHGSYRYCVNVYLAVFEDTPVELIITHGKDSRDEEYIVLNPLQSIRLRAAMWEELEKYGTNISPLIDFTKYNKLISENVQVYDLEETNSCISQIM